VYFFLFCVLLYIVCVYTYTVRLPPGGYSIAVKYIMSNHGAVSNGSKCLSLIRQRLGISTDTLHRRRERSVRATSWRFSNRRREVAIL